MTVQTKFPYLILCIVLATVFWFLPVPEGVPPNGMHLLGIFLATILGIILKAMPMAAVALLGLTVTILTHTLTFDEAFSGFHHPVVWLIVAAFFIARGFTKTGLGTRISYLFVGAIGKKTLGLSYGLIASELILSPAIPSNTARTGGVIYPILSSLSRSFGSDPTLGTAHRMGGFLTVVAFQATGIASAMFLTSMAPNPLIASFALEQGVDISWGGWAIAAVVPGIVSLLLMPLLVYKIYPPEVKETPGAAELAKTKLREMGKISPSEWIMLFTFVLLLVLWVFGKGFGVSPTAAALLGLCLLLISGVLTWKEVLNEHGAWETLFWFGALIAMASFLSQLGVVAWVGKFVSAAAQGFNWPIALLLLCLVYFYLHYFFASILAHVVALYPVFLAAAIGAGAPPMIAALLLAFLSSLYGGLTHYGSGPGAILYGSGYVPIGTWWKLGALVSVLNLVIWGCVGGLWWKLLGLW